MTSALVLAILRGLAICLATGAATTLATYQQVGRWSPALVAGGTAASAWVLAQLAGSGAVTSLQSARKPSP